MKSYILELQEFTDFLDGEGCLVEQEHIRHENGQLIRKPKTHLHWSSSPNNMYPLNLTSRQLGESMLGDVRLPQGVDIR